jgi:hypothetical protein
MNLVKLRWDLTTGETQGFGVDQELGLSDFRVILETVSSLVITG